MRQAAVAELTGTGRAGRARCRRTACIVRAARSTPTAGTVCAAGGVRAAAAGGTCAAAAAGSGVSAGRAIRPAAAGGIRAGRAVHAAGVASAAGSVRAARRVHTAGAARRAVCPLRSARHKSRFNKVLQPVKNETTQSRPGVTKKPGSRIDDFEGNST